MSTIAKTVRSAARVLQIENRRLVEAQESERARIARELHDGIGQKVALLQMDLDHAARTLAPHGQGQLRQLSAQIADIARDLHEVSHELHPLRLEILGLAKSIEALCNETRRQSKIEITFSCDAAVPGQIGASESLCLYRVAQEALHNVVKHSKATRASVQLMSLRGALRLIISDTGLGFDNLATTDGLGLTSMRQRVGLLNGRLAVHTRRNGGTRVCARIPLRRHVTPDVMPPLSPASALVQTHRSAVRRLTVAAR